MDINRITIDTEQGTETISRHIYGHFAEHLGRCIYDGIWVGEGSEIPNVRGIRTDIVEALKAIKIPNLRWPGGCFADDYHWMETLMKNGNPGSSFQGVSLHYYTICNNWSKKGSAIQFDEKEYCEKYSEGPLSSTRNLPQTPLVTQDRELRWIACEIHDGFLSCATAALMCLQSLQETKWQSDRDAHEDSGS